MDANSQLRWALGLLLPVTFLPTLIFYLVGTGSQSPGLGVTALLVVLLYAAGVAPNSDKISLGNWLLVSLLLVVLLMSHLVVATILQSADFGRAAQSAPVAALMLVAAACLAHGLAAFDDRVIARVTNIIRGLFIGFGVLAIVGVQPPTALVNEKVVFPFAEPSHYALAFAPFLIHGCVLTTPTKRYALLLTAFAIAFSLQSLSLVVATVLAAVVSVKPVPLVLGSAAAWLISTYVDLDYYTVRLDFSEDSQNLSALVYRQGWELIGDALARTKGWGLGFQQLGVGPINSPTADLIYRILRDDANLRDGGFTAAKVISEFGIFGIAMAAMLGVVAIKAAWQLRAGASRRSSIGGLTQLSNSFIVGYSIEAYVRGIGYFSGTTILVLAGLIYLHQRRDRLAPGTN